MQGLGSAVKTMTVKLNSRVGLIPSPVKAYRNQPGFGVVVTDQRMVVARTAAAAEPWRFSAELSQRIHAGLVAAGIDSWSVQPRGNRITQWCVRADEIPAALDALVDALSGAGCYLRKAGSAPVLIDPAARALIRSWDGAIDIFQYLQIDRRVSAGQARCQVLPWELSDRGTLCTPNRTAVVQEVLDDRPVGQATLTCWDGAVQPRPQAVAESDACEIGFPVDAVYVWADESDPRWQARHDAAYQEQFGPAESPVKAPIRRRNHGELQASLRSLEMYAPWIRNVYLVTDQQRPDWLDPTSTRVRVIDHREIFADPSLLPTFNPQAVDTQVHHIAGLSEYYLLMSQDILFSQPVSAYDFFTPAGQLKIPFSQSRRPLLEDAKLSLLEQAQLNSARLLEAEFGRQATQVSAPTPVPQSISVATEVSQRFSAAVTRALAHPFGSPLDDLASSWLGLYTALFTGRGVVSELRYATFDVANSAARQRLSSPAGYRKASVICVNDSDAQAAESPSSWVQDWLRRTYPVPTRYELVGDPEAGTSHRLGSG